jgi:hypothetical protein
MTQEKTETYIKDIPKPSPPDTDSEKVIRMTLLSARRSSIIGLVLIALPGTLVFLLFLQNTLHIFPGLVRWLAGSGTFLPLPLRAILFFLFLVGFPFVAVAVNLLSISWFRYYHHRKELVISIRMRWVNILIAIIGGALAAFYILHLLADTLLGQG